MNGQTGGHLVQVLFTGRSSDDGASDVVSPHGRKENKTTKNGGDGVSVKRLNV